MKRCYYKRVRFKLLFVFSFLLIFLALSCKKDTESKVHFSVIDNPLLLEVDSEGTTKEYNIQSDGNWRVKPVVDTKWISVEPTEGQGNGSFTLIVHKNTAIDGREIVLAFMAGEHYQNETLTIRQEEGADEKTEEKPYILIEGLSEEKEISDQGLNERMIVRANGEWKIEIPSDIDWLTIEPMQGVGDVPVDVSVDMNKVTASRSATLSLLHNDSPFNTLNLTQQALKQNVGDVILEEDFNWLTVASHVLYTVTGEKRFDNWDADELEHGWKSSVNPVEGSGGTPLLYARYGFVKLGKTSYSGDLISPKLEAIAGKRNVKVTFKAVPYQTQAGTRDDNILNVNVMGPGTIEGSDEFVLDNWPDYDTDPEGVDIWQDPSSTYSFIIEGATEETQFRFLGQDYDMRTPKNPNKNRVFIDDITVTIAED